MAALAQGSTSITHCLWSEDVKRTFQALQGLGCSDEQLSRLSRLSRGEPRPPADGPTSLETVKELLARETPCGALREKGITAHHCRIAGADVSLLERLGFPMAELSHVYPIRDLKRAGHGVRELTTHFSDGQLRAAGFSAVEMRMAGRTIQDLQRAGYNENHIRTAGYSHNELALAGLGHHVRDSLKGM